MVEARGSSTARSASLPMTMAHEPAGAWAPSPPHHHARAHGGPHEGRTPVLWKWTLGPVGGRRDSQTLPWLRGGAGHFC